MDPRASLSLRRPLSPRRTAIESSHVFQQHHRPPTLIPPRLSAIRSASQPLRLSDLTPESPTGESGNAAAFLRNTDLLQSPESAALEYEEPQPPAKRAKTNGADFRSERQVDHIIGHEQETEDAAHILHKASPLPILPPIPSLANKSTVHRRHRLAPGSATRKSSAVLDPPAMATRLPAPKRAAEFYPWVGRQPEDLLNENVIKSGFVDRASGVNQAECNSAKATAYATLNQKNSHGLSLLGYLFTTVLEKRQMLGKCVAPSTFKPPPRVTVTDTKREAWLRDLANPEVPLRKQSRTIPHGIRGKLLMEQCLAKAVPLPRTVWLAKCVGANELRAFRRKGTSGSAAASGETKWVREWTSHVEQFLEDVINTCSQVDWQHRIQYAVKLGAALYSERLLEKGQFLDWIVSSLASSPLHRLPIWIVLAQLFWKEITLHGKRGRRLAEGLLQHLDCIKQANQDAFRALKTRLQHLVLLLATTSQGCLIIPGTWKRYEHLFTVDELGSETLSISSLNNIRKRNRNLTNPLSESSVESLSPTRALLSVMDSTTLQIDIAKLTDTCLHYSPDINLLVQTLLDWASTTYRTGKSRIYLSARIIADLQQRGFDTDLSLLQYLGEASNLPSLSVEHIHRVVVELVRLRAFSTGRYLQWLVTSGIINAGRESTCATSLVAALPINDLPVRVLNAWKAVMRRLGHSLQEREPMNAALARLEAGNGKEDSIDLDSFCQAREVSEQSGDIRLLTMILKSGAHTDNAAILATICDTVNKHAETLAALGNLDEFLECLGNRYIYLRTHQPLERALILALLSLAGRLPDQAQLAKLLKDDLVLCEQHSSFAICSPASDSIIGMHASTLDSSDDLNAVFASGNTMDEQLMRRVFGHIMKRAGALTAHETAAVEEVGGWLRQLRIVDSSGVLDELVEDYVGGCSTLDTESRSWRIGIVHLVSSGILPYATLVKMAGAVTSAEVAYQMVPLFLHPKVADIGLHPMTYYRYRLQQELCEAEHVDKILRLVQMAAETSRFVPDDSHLLTFIIRVSTQRPGSLELLLADSDISEISRMKFGQVMIAILMHGSGSVSSLKEKDVRSIVEVATPLSLQFCVGALMHFRSLPSWNETDESVFTEALLAAFNNSSEVWSQLLGCAGVMVNVKLRDWAHSRILQTVTSEDVSDSGEASSRAEEYLRLLAMSERFVPSNNDAKSFNLVAERLKEIGERLSGSDESTSGLKKENVEPLRAFWILLQLTTLSVQAWLQDKDASQSCKVSLLTVLCALIASPRMQSRLNVFERLCDVASALADSISEASLAIARQQCTGSVLSDRYVQFILGSNTDAAEAWLLLASHVPPQFGSQQQRLLNKGNVRLPMPGQSQYQRVPQAGPSGSRQDGKSLAEVKTTPFALRQWEIISDPAPTMGDNDTSLSLRLFKATRV